VRRTQRGSWGSGSAVWISRRRGSLSARSRCASSGSRCGSISGPIELVMFILVCVPVHRGYRFPTAPHIFLRSRFKIIVGVSVFIRTGVSDLRFKKAATSAVFLGVHVLLAKDKEGGGTKTTGATTASALIPHYQSAPTTPPSSTNRSLSFPRCCWRGTRGCRSCALSGWRTRGSWRCSRSAPCPATRWAGGSGDGHGAWIRGRPIVSGIMHFAFCRSFCIFFYFSHLSYLILFARCQWEILQDVPMLGCRARMSKHQARRNLR